MIEFKTDQQTINDLNLLPKHHGDISILNYFNSTQTKGGYNALIHLMETPSNDIESIKNRVETIKFVGQLKEQIQACLDDNMLDIIEYYLNQNTLTLRDNFIDALFDRISYILKPNNDYYIVTTALQYVGRQISNLKLLIDQAGSDLPEFFRDLQLELQQITNDENLIALLDPKRKKLAFRQINRFDSSIRKKYTELLQGLIKRTYLLDAYLSVNQFSENSEFHFPEIKNLEQPVFKLNDIFHPFIEEPVPCNFELGRENNLCFLTGPNMAGKSTFLKAVSLSVYLAHIGFPVPAKSCELSVFNGLFTTINLSDDIKLGYSHYYSEVRRIKETALNLKSHKKLFVIFDELFRGTNVKDAYDASLLITKGFLKSKKSLFIISSHISEVGEQLTNGGLADLKYFDSRLEGDIPVNTYQLVDGISSERHGLAIVKREGIVELLEEG
jgi:DNA mismatch repair ATPase MutS